MRLKNEEGGPAEPDVYDYDEYEPRALGILLYSGYAYRQMPAEIQQEQDLAWVEEAGRVGAAIERAMPGVYTSVGYGVQD